MRKSPLDPLVACLVAAALTSCVARPYVIGPDGEVAEVLSCYGAIHCYEAAVRTCPAGYVVRSADRYNMIVSCNIDLRRRAPRPRVTSADAEPPADPITCESASLHSAQFGEHWSTRASSAKTFEAAPKKDDFVSVCLEMPENVQRCMHERYRQEHVQSCEAILSHVDRPMAQKIDALYSSARATK